MSNVDDPIRAMAATIWGEARGEQFSGQVAVGWVIQNRANNPGWWGADITGVCSAKHQFSCWWDRQAERVRTVGDTDSRFQQAMLISIGIIRHAYPTDPTGGADHYYSDYIDPPVWSDRHRPTVRIGRHLFFRIGLGA